MRLLFLFVFITFYSLSQPYKTIKVYRPYKWMVGLHWSAIDDDGDKFNRLTDVNNSWHIKPYPVRITLDRYFVYGWSMEMAASYVQYETNKVVNDSTGINGINFAFDLNGKYSFYNLYAPRARWIEPYITAGIGYTYRDKTADAHSPSVNIGGGLNFWPLYRLGIQLSSSAKFSMYPKQWDTKSNYLQHSIGIVYRSPYSKGYKNTNSKKQHKWINQNKSYKRKGGH